MSGLSRSRRAFLRTVGAAAATLPFYRLMERSAVGQSMPQPLRFIGVSGGQGTPTEFWRPMPGTGMGVDSFVINYPNSALQPFDDPTNYPTATGAGLKNYLTIIDGVDNAVAYESSPAANGHAAWPSVWTASTVSNGNPACESIETYLGVTKGLGASTSFPSVVYGPSAAYDASGQMIDSIFGAPNAFWQQLFNGYTVPMGNSQAQAAGLRKRPQFARLRHRANHESPGPPRPG